MTREVFESVWLTVERGDDDRDRVPDILMVPHGVYVCVTVFATNVAVFVGSEVNVMLPVNVRVFEYIRLHDIVPLTV